MAIACTNLEALLECLYDLEPTPDEPWAYTAIIRGLAHPHSYVRELAIGAACNAGTHMAAVLRTYADKERIPWLARYAILTAEDLTTCTI